MVRFLLEEVGKGLMGVEDPNAAGEAAFHKFLAVDAAPMGWMCTGIASTLAFIQARQVGGGGAARRGRCARRRQRCAWRALELQGARGAARAAADAADAAQIFMHLKYYSSPTLQARRQPLAGGAACATGRAPCAHAALKRAR